MASRVMRFQQGCNVIFSPNDLSGCESVEWFLNDTLGTPIGASEGNDPFSYDFLESGTYTVVAEITKKKDDGGKCDKLMKTQQVTVTCLPPPICAEGSLDNPAFDIGAHAGGLNSGGTSRGWNAVAGEPEVIEGTEGSADGWTMLLSGNIDTAGILSLSESICLDKGVGLFSTTVKSGKSNSSDRRSPGILKVFLGRGWSFPPSFSVRNPCEGIDCYELASVPLPFTDSSEWFEVQIPYDLRDWIALDSCNDFSDVLIRPVIFVTNDYGSNQGADQTFSYAELDNVCFNGTIVSVDDPSRQESIRIFPNPTNGSLTVELKSPALSAMMLRVASLTGQVVLEVQMEPGKFIHTLKTNYLPEGLYFLQMISNGQMVSMNKFVKQ